MIKADEIKVEKEINGIRYVKASLIADSVSEVIANGVDTTNIERLRPTDVLTMGSTALTSDMSVGFLKTNNSWQF